MKFLKLTVLCAAISTMTFASEEKPIQYIGDLSFADFCQAVVEDDVLLLRRALSRMVGNIGLTESHVLKRIVAEPSVECNGLNLIEFSKKRGATDVYAFIQQRQS
ncbi:DUF3718 domain-containing protein [Aliiglaciecola sp. CAU 1673]|uniref:DUF3718 domain-containing protein n=1 Tax=Aliiglaciecola sp. CAU 1673 TaxID=3032595 RepID=UPI0023DC92D6|nr:DUF3718 domain-containing protein [Aliiglaciecola sp. CAU 1673]MDF2180108.1 DUF3718 domain-containing protein [Aliiglaciecola sp. CAU 1673]